MAPPVRSGTLRRFSVLALLFLAGAVLAAGNCPGPKASYLDLTAFAGPVGGVRVGQGTYCYRLVVRDPTHPGRPFRRGRYQVELGDGTVFPDGQTVFRGRTDPAGRTATFCFLRPLAAQAWYALPLVGRGEYGESFRLSFPGDCPERAAGLPYMIDDRLGGVFCGETLPDGRTIRYMSPASRTIALYDRFAADACEKFRRALNPLMAAPSPRARLGGLQALLEQSRFEDFRDVLWDKIDALAARYGSRRDILALVARHRAADGSREADVLNGIGYGLLNQDPPRLVKLADELLDRSLALEENIYNTDSKAWSLHLQGRDVEALSWSGRSLARGAAACDDDQQGTLQEVLAHRGAIYWTLGRRWEALDDWALADSLGSGGGWTNSLPPWSDIGPIVKAHRLTQAERPAFLCPVPTGAPREDGKTPDGD